MGIVRQTFYLLKKNFQIKRRHKRLTAQEIIIPIYWLAILVIIKTTTKVKVQPAIDSSDIPIQPLTAMQGPGAPSNRTGLPSIGLVTDGDSQCEQVVSELQKITSSRTNYIRFNSTEDMLDYYKSEGEKSKMGLGFVFQKDKHGVSYTIHVAEGILPKLTTKTVFRGNCRNVQNFYKNCPAFQYISSNIASLQSVIDSTISKVMADLPYFVVPNITVQMMPKGEFSPKTGLETTVPIYMVIAFAPYITILLVNLVEEKEQKQKELLRIMGMYDTAYWLSWFLTYAIILFVACLIINAIAIPTGIFGGSNFLVMVIVFFLFSMSLIMFAFMLTPLFKKSMSAGVVANLTTILFGVLIIPLGLPNVPTYGYWLGSLLSPTAFGLVLTEAVDNTGLHFNNLSTKGPFPPSYAITMIIVDIFLYLLLALYLDAVIPAEYGKRRPPYFIFQPSFWKSVFCGGDVQANGTELHRQHSIRGQQELDDLEPVGEEMIGKEAISIHKLSKVFPGKEEVVAVDEFSIDIYEGQVTALLGHNGAGKSTLIAALTGMIMPSSGTALIYGMDITDPEQMIQIRRNIGVCPQQDVIYNFITVREHLELYAGLKGVPSDEIQPMVTSVLKDIDLEDKADDIAKNLSGGQKRKLCVGISLMGNPKVLFLDEPTSGMDPHSRRSMWSLLQEKAKDKVVLLTTHFMDEADILADYKAIMSKGKLRCAGSSLFLKNRFGIGYHLNMAVTEECDHDVLERLVKTKVTGAEIIRHHGRELAFSLPIEEVGSFAELFAALEDNNDAQQACAASKLGVSSYGVSMTTLEEVFLQLEDTMEKDGGDEDTGDDDDVGPQALSQSLNVLVPDGKGSQTSNLHHTGVDLESGNINKLMGLNKHLTQLQGMLKVNWLNTIRSPLKIFFMVILPPVFLVVGLVLMRNSSTTSKYDLSPVQVTPALYLTPASSENYATPLLFENSTGSNVGEILKFLKDYNVNVDIVSLKKYLDVASGVKPFWVLGLKALKFPQAKNMSAKPSLSSQFHLRFNDTMLHSIPLGVNLISSLFNMYALQAQNKTPYPIKTTFKELPNLKPKWSYDANAFVSVLLIGLGFVIFPGSFAIMIVAQRQMGARHLLRVSGLPSFIYWIYLFISDGILFVLPTIIMLIVIAAVGVASLSSGASMGCLVLSVTLYIPSCTLFSYCLSFLFDKWETCQQVLPSVFSYLGLLPFVAVSLIDMIANPDAAIIVHYVLSFIDPVYPIIGALYYINRIHLFATVTAQSNDVTIPASSYFSWTKHNGLPATWIAMVIHSVLFGTLLHYLDTRKAGGHSSSFLCREKRSVASPTFHSSNEEEDVKAEKDKMAATNLSDSINNLYSVAVKGLWKRFGKGKKQKVVVKDLYFGVKPGEVFGLLGPNGAGKTTTLNMITGAVDPSRGQMTVAGFDMGTHAQEIFQRMGYCPQTDALWPDITLEEHLICYAKVRGIPSSDIQSTVNYFMSAMKVTEHANKRSKALSGGTKRKLSFQIAMLGGPDLLLLDEPSTGLDPSARRFLWNTISKNVCGERGAILTTHSMEEADALSSRVGIMVKGEMKCLGSTQHLKSKYGSGYSLEVKVMQGGNRQSSLDDFVKNLFPGAILNETFGGKSTYKVPNDDVSKLSSIFAKLEEGKQSIGIEEYSFSQSTLEQVFLEFAREQDDDRTGDKDNKDRLPPDNGSVLA